MNTALSNRRRGQASSRRCQRLQAWGRLVVTCPCPLNNRQGLIRNLRLPCFRTLPHGHLIVPPLKTQLEFEQNACIAIMTRSAKAHFWQRLVHDGDPPRPRDYICICVFGKTRDYRHLKFRERVGSRSRYIVWGYMGQSFAQCTDIQL